MNAAVRAPGDKRKAIIDRWKQRFQENPFPFVFLGLTVAALGRGLAAMLSSDAHKSQRMMRYRVLFQLCTVGAVIGGVYYQAAKQAGGAPRAPKEPAVDAREYLRDGSRFDLEEGRVRSDDGGSSRGPAPAAPPSRELR